jgi:hypothetical protein
MTYLNIRLSGTFEAIEDNWPLQLILSEHKIDVIVVYDNIINLRDILLNRLLRVVTILVFGSNTNIPTHPMSWKNVLYTQT